MSITTGRARLAQVVQHQRIDAARIGPVAERLAACSDASSMSTMTLPPLAAGALQAQQLVGQRAVRAAARPAG
jgi:hypothetical protein